MTRINLLPWRAELRRQQRIEFAAITALCAMVTLGVVFGVNLMLEGELAYQQQRNEFLRTETGKIERQIKEIKELEQERERLISRMRAIETLQSSRPAIVHVLDDIVTTLPDGVLLTEIQQKGDTFEISGVAQSNARVSSFMRNIERSEWLKEPKLEVIETSSKNQSHGATFKLRARQQTPHQDAAAGGDQLP